MSYLPEIIGYDLIEKIGSGSLACVYKAHNPEQRAVALKVLLSQEPEDIERFKSEFLLLRGLNHPNIVKAYDFGNTRENNPYLSMEYIDGNDFKSYFQNTGHQWLFYILFQVCQTLEFLHIKEIIHGDIKPSNILISSDKDNNPKVKFTDFGFAEYRKGLESSYWKGTIPYLAPEIIRGEEYDHQSDLYSLGVMMYEVLTGALPFEESDAMSMAKGHLEKEVEFPINPEIPQALKQIIIKLLKKDPLDRYYSAREVMEDIKLASATELKDDESVLARSLIASPDVIGRNEDLFLLKCLYEESKCGRTEIVLIKGEQGVGKTRFFNEFKGFVQTDGGTVAWKTLSKTNENLLSELQDFLNLPPPLVLIIDDFQKAKAEMVDTLVDFLKERKKQKLLICLALNDNLTLSEEDQKAKLIESIIESNLETPLTKIVLRPLNGKDAGNMINSMLKWKADSEVINKALYNKTGGNPFLLTYLMNSSLEDGFLKRVGSCWDLELSNLNLIDIPQEYKEQIIGRLSRLSPESLNLLETISVLGEEFEPNIVPELTDQDEEKISNYLTLLFMENLLKKNSSSSESKIFFVNGIIRYFIYSSISELKRKELHLKCGKVLEKLYSANTDSVLHDLSYHFIKGENKGLGFKYSLLAGAEAEKNNDSLEAIRHYENSLNFYGQTVDKPEISKQELLARLAKQYGVSGDFDRALFYYTQAIETIREQDQIGDQKAKLYQQMGVLYLRKGYYAKAIEILNKGLSICGKNRFPKVSAEIYTSLGWVYQKKSDYPQAISCFEKSITLLGKDSSKELGLALNGLGVAYWCLGEFNKASSCYQKSLKIHEESKDAKGLATVYMNLGLLKRSLGDPKQALDYFQKALELEQEFGNLANLSFLFNNLALACENLHDWDKSLEYHQKSYELKEKIGDQNGLAITLNNLGLVHLRRGVLSKALDDHSKALRLFLDLKDKPGVAHSSCSLGELYLMRGEWDKSKSYLERSLRLRQELNDKSGIAESLAFLGRVNLEREDFLEASSQLNESLRLYDALQNHQKMVEVSLSFAELGLRQENSTEAEVHLSYAEKLLSSIDDQVLKGRFLRIEGFLLSKKGAVDECLDRFLEAHDIFRRLKIRYELGLTYLEIGKIKSVQQRFKEARAYLKEALSIFRDMDIRVKVSECEGLMKERSGLSQVDLLRTEVLYQIADLLNNIVDLDELLVRILDLAIEHLSAERAAIILYNSQDDSLDLKAARGIEIETKADALSISRRVIRDVLKHDAPLIIEDACNDPEVGLYKSVVTYNILSILCVPLTSKNKTLGTIYLDHRSLRGMFSKDDLDFLRAFANLIAVSLEKANLYSELNEEVFQLKKDLRKTYSYPNIIGRSKKMQEVFQMVEKVANTKTSILLLGESGTGKELIANIIHHTGVRKDKPFVKVNCAALTESILESELFGVEEKVATGVAMRDGKFKQADGGTIFFDEIGDMSLSTQAKVLRVLQEREFERVGGSKTIKVDIRVISATNKDLDECIKKGAFRKDLFYRLNPVTIKIPPLRERKEDIPYLVDYFLDRFSKENNKSKIAVPVKVMNSFMDYTWPGNVREVGNLIERAVLFSEDGLFPGEYLPSQSQIQRSKRLLSPKESLSKTLASTEKEMILSALGKNDYNQVKAAIQLGMNEATLRRRMKKHGIIGPKKDPRRK